MIAARSNALLTITSSTLIAAFCVFWFSDTVADPDLWGHVRFGQDILQNRSIVQADAYSYRTTGQPWINHEWLSEVIFASIDARSGPMGLVVLKVAVSLLIFGLCHIHLRRCGLGPLRSGPLLLLISVPMIMGLRSVRPQLFTYLLFFIELLLIVGATRGRIHRLWLLPAMFAFWVNVHGGVLAGVGLLGLWAAARIIERPAESTRLGGRLALVARIGPLSITCGLALLLNPYGAQLIIFLLRTATGPRPEIQERKPLALMSLPGLVYLLLLAIGIFGLFRTQRPRNLEMILPLAAISVLPMTAGRHYPLFALALIVLAGEHISDAWNRAWPPRELTTGPLRGVAAFGVVGSLLLIGLALPRFGCIRIDPSYFAFPARAVALLKRSGFQGNVAVPFDWGEYVIGHLGPAVKVSNDGRRETVYSDEVYRQSRDFERGTGIFFSCKG